MHAHPLTLMRAGRKALGAPRKSVAVQASLEDGVERAFSAAADR